MKRATTFILLVVLFLNACAPAPTPTVTPSIAPTPTLTPVPTSTPTPRPSVTLKEDASLYSGPGNEGYDSVAQLKAGSVLYPLGAYIDFIKIETVVNGKTQTGFVAKRFLNTSISQVAELNESQVPWLPLSILHNFVSGQTSFNNKEIKVENNTDGYYDIGAQPTSPIILDSPIMLTVKMQVRNTTFGSVKLYGIPSFPEKKWWEGIRRMDVAISSGSLVLGLRDGTTEGYKTSIKLPLNADQQISIIFKDAQGKTFTVLDQDQREVKVVDVTAISSLQMQNGLFPDKKMYLGASSSPKSTLTLNSISLQKPPIGKFTSNAEKKPRLRELADKNGITIGTEFSIWNMQKQSYWDIMTTDYNVAALSEFSCYKDFWQGRGNYNFEPLDRIVDFAIQQGLKVRASHLIWGAYENCPFPDWLLKDNFTRDEYLKILEEYIKAVVTHFKGRVTEWSIANEATNRSFCNGGCDFWADRIGPDYIEKSFRWAREADPNGILIFNEDNNDSPRDTNTQRTINKMYFTVKTLKDKGVPIDVVGMQMHILLPWNSQIRPRKEDVIKTMKMFADLGVSIYITEFDVNLQAIGGSQKDKWEYEASIYRDMLESCLESKVCKSFTTWGVSDSTSWITCTSPGCVNLPNADPLMFDKDFQPKPAYYAVRDVLAGKPTTTATPKP